MSAGDSPTALSALLAEARTELQARHDAWSQAMVQDAIESMRRLGRWHLIRRGCRVPVHDLYCVSMWRQAERLARRFVEQGAASLSKGDPAATAEAVLAGQGCIEGLALEPSQVDRVYTQGTFESPVDFLRRFESELCSHVDSLFEQRLSAWFGETLDRVCAAWAEGS
jgi:hypothetical protein